MGFGWDGWVGEWVGKGWEGGGGREGEEYSMSMVRSWGGVGWIGVDWCMFVCGGEGGRERGGGWMEGIVNVALIHLGVRYEYERGQCAHVRVRAEEGGSW